jgi:acyl carrier protein
VRLGEQIRQALGRRPQQTVQAPGPAAVVDVALAGRAEHEYGDMERHLARIWAAELGLVEINVLATLFDLGGDSLIALRLANSIRQALGTKLTMAEIFAHPTVAELAEHLGRPGGGETVATMSAVDDVGPDWFELWNVQRGMWLQHQLEENRAELNLPVWHHVHFEVDVAVLREAVNFLVDRHCALRLVFKDTTAGPRQSLLATYTVEVPLVDLAGSADLAGELDRLIHTDNRLAFGDLVTPPVRAKLYRLGAGHYCVYLNVHHIVSDGTSMGILLRELQMAYEAIAAGGRPLMEPLPTTYDEYLRGRCRWFKSAESHQMERFWRKELTAPVPRLRLGDYDAPAEDVVNEWLEFSIEPGLTAALGKTARSLDVTVHILLLAAYFVVLHDITTDGDIVVGVPFSGRDTKDLENLVGLFINALSVRIQLSGADTFADVVGRTKRKSVDAYANGRYPCTDLVERLKADHPELLAIFTTAFQFTDFLPPAGQTAQLDACLNGRRRGDEIELRFSYNPRRLSKSEATDIKVSLLALLARITQDATETVSALAGPMKQARQQVARVPGRQGRLQSLMSARRGRG